MRTTRTNRYLLYGAFWLLAFILIVAIFSSAMALGSERAPSIGTKMIYSQIGSFIWLLGFASIFFSWARVDATEHGRPKNVAFTFSLLWLFFNVFAHLAYLFYTRGWREGALSSLRFICYVLSVAILWVGFFKILGTLSS